MLDLEEYLAYANEARNFNSHNGLRITELREHRAVSEVSLTQNGRDLSGKAHGSLLYALCDFTVGIAAGSKDRNMLTLDARIRYLAPGTGGKLRCVAECVKDGRKTGLFEARVYDEDGELLAQGSFTVYYTPGTVDLAERRRRDAEALREED